jgi:thiol-disulfide isomerase/thioredoxin
MDVHSWIQPLKPVTKFGVILLSCLALLSGHSSARDALHSFVPGSLAEIKQAREGKPFILMFWSLDCPSCVKELDALANALRRRPGLNIVMVSTDVESPRQPVEAMLDKHGLGRVESWIFAIANTQRLRYEIDSTWFGELPRNYFYDADHNRIAHSGALGAKQIDAWLAAIKP